MAQTKRKRQTKHRGNAAGGIVARGRTGRPPTAEEKKRNDRDQRREERLNRKPTLKGAALKALLAGAFMFVFVLFTTRSKGSDRLVSAVLTAAIATVLYVGLGYYIETFLWRRRMAKKASASRR